MEYVTCVKSFVHSVKVLWVNLLFKLCASLILLIIKEMISILSLLQSYFTLVTNDYYKLIFKYRICVTLIITNIIVLLIFTILVNECI